MKELFSMAIDALFVLFQVENFQSSLEELKYSLLGIPWFPMLLGFITLIGFLYKIFKKNPSI